MKALERLSVYPGTGTADGIAGEHILVAPPFTITETEIDFIVDTLSDAIRSVASEEHLECPTA